MVVGGTAREALDKRENDHRHASVEASLTHYSASTGVDFSMYGLDESIERASTNGNQRAKPVTLRQIIDQTVLGCRMRAIVGSGRSTGGSPESLSF
ncbi:Putative desulfurization/monoxygenase (fragment) [Rhizobium mesoamericanum STM3625]|uniref:Putative desulfurization/monoxygenase n=1 Tax=Rhizobium mesoamericanum STM3625 TaxID=1211777 RepID=K0PXV9_9HYPH